jgi:hypothetical protein
LKSPVLLIAFNRPELTRNVLGGIKLYKPDKIYISQDGPRQNIPKDLKKCAEVKEVLNQEITWDCDIKFRELNQNLGCAKAPSSAIDWFFEHESEGIILEDDCLPNLDFFRFCEINLAEYRELAQVHLIAGANMMIDSGSPNSYYYSYFGGTWGWATWKDAWQNFALYRTGDEFRQLLGRALNNAPITFREYLKNQFSRTVCSHSHDIWDFQWLFTRLAFDGLSVVPNKNLVTNIGFGKDSTHTFKAESSLALQPLQEIEFPLSSPDAISIDPKLEYEMCNRMFGEVNEVYRKPKLSIWTRLRRKISK